MKAVNLVILIGAGISTDSRALNFRVAEGPQEGHGVEDVAIRQVLDAIQP